MKKLFTSWFHWIYIFKEDIIASLTEKTLVAQALRLSYFISIQPEKWKFSDSIKNDEKPCQGMNLVGFQLGPTRLNLVGQLENTWKVNLVENPNSEIRHFPTWLEIQTQKFHFLRVQLGSTEVNWLRGIIEIRVFCRKFF